MQISAVFNQVFLNIVEQKVYIYVLVFFIFIVLLKLIVKFRKNTHDLKYKSIGALFSNAEHSFFLVLKQALSENYEVFAKVRIADVLQPEKCASKKNWYTALNRITSKHFDYVLCDKNTFSVVAVIELDDKSHNQSKVKRRDAFVERVCESANLKLLRFQCKSQYQIKTVRDAIFSALN